jgi:hypothetical protein
MPKWPRSSGPVRKELGWGCVVTLVLPYAVGHLVKKPIADFPGKCAVLSIDLLARSFSRIRLREKALSNQACAAGAA